MKKIAITQRFVENTDYYEIRECLDIRWGKLFRRANILPVPLLVDFDFEKIFENLNIDGLVLTGGNSLSIISDNELSKRRDKFEIKVLEYAINKELPVFAVCRGMHVLGNFFGQEIISVKDHVKKEHDLTVYKESKYYNVLSKMKSVNSYHNYALDSCGQDFYLSASSSDGCIEAIEHKKLKIFAQMWHPERSLSDLDILFLKHFFK